MYNDYYGTPSYGYNAANTGSAAGILLGILGFMCIIVFAIQIVMIISMWKVFTKCGEKGWKSLIPIYNVYVMTQIAEVEWWYIFLFIVPIVNIYAMYVIYNNIAKKFGKSTGFTIGMIFLPIVFFPMLAFGKDNVAQEQTAVSTEPVNNVNPTVNVAPVNPAPVASYSVNVMETQVDSTPVVNEPVNMMETPVNPAPVANEPVNMMETPVNPAPVASEPDIDMVEDMSDVSNEMDQLFNANSFVEQSNTMMQNNNIPNNNPQYFNNNQNNGQM